MKRMHASCATNEFIICLSFVFKGGQTICLQLSPWEIRNGRTSPSSQGCIDCIGTTARELNRMMLIAATGAAKTAWQFWRNLSSQTIVGNIFEEKC